MSYRRERERRQNIRHLLLAALAILTIGPMLFALALIIVGA